MNRLILAALKEGKDVRIASFRFCRFTDSKEGFHIREDGSGLTSYDKLTLAGVKRASNWIGRTTEEARLSGLMDREASAQA